MLWNKKAERNKKYHKKNKAKTKKYRAEKLRLKE